MVAGSDQRERARAAPQIEIRFRSRRHFESGKISRLILNAGADPNDSQPDGVSALVLAAHSGNGGVAALLLEHGADPNARATIRKQLRDMGDPEKEALREFHQVTPISYARSFQEPAWVNEPALAAIAAHGGTG